MSDQYRQLLVKKRSGIQHYCDACDWHYNKTGRYPRCCPGMAKYLIRAVRRMLKMDTRKQLDAE